MTWCEKRKGNTGLGPSFTAYFNKEKETEKPSTKRWGGTKVATQKKPLSNKEKPAGGGKAALISSGAATWKGEKGGTLLLSRQEGDRACIMNSRPSGHKRQSRGRRTH